MKYGKRMFSGLLFAFVLVLGFAFPVFAQDEAAAVETALENQLTRDDLQAMNGDDIDIFEHNGRVTFVSGKCTEEPVPDLESAAAVVESMVELLGGDIRTQFIPWRDLTDASGNRYYVFKQIYAGTTVMGGAAKVITDPEGNMIGLSSSLETDLPEIEGSEGITAEEAEQIVLKYAEENNQPLPTVLEGYTDKMILPVILRLDIDDEQDNASRFVWVVYTDNPENPMNHSSEFPYLAHYVTMAGEYLYSLETLMPGDAVSSTGFDSEYLFLDMEPAEYTGYVDLSDGTEKEITVTVMRDKRTGMYYLGNIERKIVVANCYEFLYNGGRIVLESSPDNKEWDQVGLLSFYNYCRAYDYYKEIGWTGGDGLGTPILILNDYQDKNHVQVDNAAFVGNYLGWSMFLTSYANDLAQCLDVIAHEFTHCVTDATMTYNSYMNDYGAINEGMSDIQGQICEMMSDDTKDATWLLGDNSTEPFRSMSNPRLLNQPEFSWDLYYTPNVQTPTLINDHGGVHSNSSLLNNVAYRLVANGGMSLEEARAFWFAVDCTMVPGTDYPQLRELLPWVLKSQGMDQYQTALTQSMDAVRLGDDTLPDFFDDDRALVKLTLPDNANFTNGNWAMWYFSVDIHGFVEKVANIFNVMSSGDYSELPQALQQMLAEPEPTPEPEKIEPENNDRGFFSEISEFLSLLEGSAKSQPTPEPTPVAYEMSAEDYRELKFWLTEEFADVIYSTFSFAGQDGRTIQMVSVPGRTIPILLYVSFSGENVTPDQMIPVIFMNGRWYEIPDMMSFTTAEEGEEQPSLAGDEKISRLMEDTVSNIFENLGNVKSIDDALDLISYTVKGGEVNEIPADGLETIVIPEVPAKTVEEVSVPENNIPPRKSRPKADAE